MTNEIISDKMKELAKMINYEYNDLSFLSKAMHCQLIHSDGDGKYRKNYTNSNFATLGDSILKFVLTEYLFDKGYDQAEITNSRGKLENNNKLFELCDNTGIFRYAYNDSCFFTEALPENQINHSQHDVYIEAIIAAIYKDKGFDYCKQWIYYFFSKYNIISI